MAETHHEREGRPQGGGGGASPGEIPLGQRLFDNWVLLLVACIVVMFVFFTGWGVVEMATLPEAPLP